MMNRRCAKFQMREASTDFIGELGEISSYIRAEFQRLIKAEGAINIISTHLQYVSESLYRFARVKVTEINVLFSN